MEKKRNRRPYLEGVEITAFGSEGKALGKVNDQVVFVPYAAPGDIVDIQVSKKRRSYMEGEVTRFHQYSSLREQPFCKHFTICGGCRWQHVPYSVQLEFKQQQVEDQLLRIGRLSLPQVSAIIAAGRTTQYRNKLEYSFSDMKWLTDYTSDTDFSRRDMDALGFHPPGRFDRILDIEECFLQDTLTNDIRNYVKSLAKAQGYPFFNARRKTGLLRNLLLRNNLMGEWMVVLVLSEKDEKAIAGIFDPLREKFPQIISLMYIINEKPNDSLDGLTAATYSGRPFLTERLGGLDFKISPLSFFQTNSLQAFNLYEHIRQFAGLTGQETVYDLYTGTGSIALYIAAKARKVIGIEYVPEAIQDARENMQWNGVTNTCFFSGDITEVLDDAFVSRHGKPSVIITDPPRAGMHKSVVAQILKIKPARIVYVSCNPATQARDVALMDETYAVTKVQPLDMFPHTHHLENILLLELKQPLS